MTGEMSLEEIVPLRHAIDLMLIVALTGALGQVTLGPLAIASGELANAFDGILLGDTFIELHEKLTVSIACH